MTADIGTKPLSSERIKVLREEMNMFEVPSTEKEEEEKNVDESVSRLREGAGADLEKAAVASRLREGAGADLEKAAVALRLREGAGADLEKAAVALKLLTLAAVLSVAKGEEEEESDQEEDLMEFNMMRAVFTVMVIGATLAIQCLWKAWTERLRTRVRSQAGSANQGLVAEKKRKRKRW